MSTAKTRNTDRHSHQPAAARAEHVGMPDMVVPDRIVRECECKKRTGLSRTTRWRLERVGKFPRRRRLSEGCTGWLESEIAAWIATR